jgi:hypothetical protein
LAKNFNIRKHFPKEKKKEDKGKKRKKERKRGGE